MLVIGIDDAGRGPLIGPMILAGVLIDQEKEKELKEMGAKDSKLLSHPERVRLAEHIKQKAKKYYSVQASPHEIDSFVLGGENLNTLEARKMAEVINNLNDGKKEITVIVDCPSINTVKWRKKLMSFITHASNLNVVCEHKADFNYPVVSAASILAKVEREEEVSKIKSVYGDIGSGYPSDPYTKKFLIEKGYELRDSGIFRKSWATWQERFPNESSSNKSNKQKTLFEW